MQQITVYNINEITALITAVLIGTGGYIGFVVVRKKKEINFKFIFWVLMINLFVTYLFSELLKVMNWGVYRTLVLPLVAYAGQYLIDWFDKRYLKIFDAGASKAGLNINNNTDENHEPQEINDNQERSGN